MSRRLSGMQNLGCTHDLGGKCVKLDVAELAAGGEQGAALQAAAAVQLKWTPDSIFAIFNLGKLDDSGVPVMLQLLGAGSRGLSTCRLGLNSCKYHHACGAACEAGVFQKHAAFPPALATRKRVVVSGSGDL